MAKNQFGLGKGLGALLGGEDLSELRKPVGYINKEVVSADAKPQDTSDVLRIPVDLIEPNPYQPRVNFATEAMQELADSIRTFGLIQPITVRRKGDGKYQIISGERRYRASIMAGMDMVPAYIRDASEQGMLEMAIVENIQRENLDPIEEAEGYRSLRDKYGMTQEQIASRVAKSRPVIANALRLLALPEDVRGYLQTGALSPSIARLLLELDGDPVRSTAAEEIVTKQLTVREAQALIKRLKRPPRPEKTPIEEIDYTAEAEKTLTHALGRKVRITGTPKKGRIELEFYGPEDRENLISALRRLNKMKE